MGLVQGNNHLWADVKMSIEALTTFCFGFSCIAVPTYIYLKFLTSWKNSRLFDLASNLAFLLIISFFIFVEIAPWI